MKSSIIMGLAALALAGCQASSDNQSAAANAGGVQVTGAGSTFVYPVLSAWASDYSKQNGTQINYQSIGSGGGISQVKAGTVDFGATDQPLASDELARSRLAQFPVVIGGIVPVINIAGLAPGKLRLTGRCSPTFSRARSRNGTTRRSSRLTPAWRCRRRTSRSSTVPTVGHHLQLHPLSEPGQRHWKAGRVRGKPFVALGRRRQGQ